MAFIGDKNFTYLLHLLVALELKADSSYDADFDVASL